MSRSAKRKTPRLVVGFGLKLWNGAGIPPGGGHGWNQAERRPLLDLQIAKAFLAGVDSDFVGRTWSEVKAVFLNTTAGKKVCALDARSLIKLMTRFGTSP